MGSPLNLVTGLPGHGKTLNTIKEVDAQAVKEGRLVYFHNIRGLKPELLKAEWYEFEDPHKWFELPENSLIVVDEAQGFFPPRDIRKPVPEYCSKMETVRHEGRELWLITQHPSFIDVHARRLTNRHIHFKRIFKSSRILRHEWEGVSDVDKASSFKAAMTTPIKLDKKFFDVYQSTAQGASHFFKFKAPLALYALLLCLGVVAVFGYRFYQRYQEKVGAHDAPTEQQALPSGAAVLGSVVDAVAPESVKGKGKQTLQEYLADRTPRIASVPSSAPIYDELTKPVSFPRTYCVSTTNETLLERNSVRSRMKVGWHHGKKTGCGCYTQQGSQVQTTFEYCMNAVENRFFDPTLPDHGSQQVASLPQPPTAGLVASGSDVGAPRDVSSGAPLASATDGGFGGTRLTIVPDSEYPSRPWR